MGKHMNGQVYGIIKRKVDILQKGIAYGAARCEDVLSDVCVSAQNHQGRTIEVNHRLKEYKQKRVKGLPQRRYQT